MPEAELLIPSSSRRSAHPLSYPNCSIQLPPSSKILYKLPGAQFVMKFYILYEALNSIPMFTRSRHVYLSWARLTL